MSLEDCWKDLDVQKQSIFLIFNAKYVQAITPFGEDFMLMYGENRYHHKCMLIDSTRQHIYYKITQSTTDSLGICKSVLVNLLQMDIPNTMNKYDFETVIIKRRDE